MIFETPNAHELRTMPDSITRDETGCGRSYKSRSTWAIIAEEARQDIARMGKEEYIKKCQQTKFKYYE